MGNYSVRFTRLSHLGGSPPCFADALSHKGYELWRLTPKDTLSAHSADINPVLAIYAVNSKGDRNHDYSRKHLSQRRSVPDPTERS